MIRRSGNRFADKIMRRFEVSARSDAKPVSTFADRALCAPVGMTALGRVAGASGDHA
jgi:hypothetical protein